MISERGQNKEKTAKTVQSGSRFSRFRSSYIKLFVSAYGFSTRDVNKKYKTEAKFVVHVEVLAFSFWKSAALVIILYGRSRLRLNICSASHFIHVLAYGYVVWQLMKTLWKFSAITLFASSGFSSISKSTPVGLKLLPV